MLSKILFEREHKLFNELLKEKNIFRKLAKAVELNAVAQACNEAIYKI